MTLMYAVNTDVHALFRHCNIQRIDNSEPMKSDIKMVVIPTYV